MSDFLHKFLHPDSVEEGVDSIHKDEGLEVVVDDHNNEDDVDYEALKRDTRWVWGSSYDL